MTKNKKGFTIIEVVLVLAIAGLIFLMVFIALPALQRSQRNTRRRQDMARILSAFSDYQANNNGKMPESADHLSKFVNRYVTGVNDYSTSTTITDSASLSCTKSDQFCDPDGTSYHFVNRYWKKTDSTGQTISAPASFDHGIYYNNAAKCGDAEDAMVGGRNPQEIAIFYYLEGGAIYCGDNQ